MKYIDRPKVNCITHNWLGNDNNHIVSLECIAWHPFFSEKFGLSSEQSSSVNWY